MVPNGTTVKSVNDNLFVIVHGRDKAVAQVPPYSPYPQGGFP